MNGSFALGRVAGIPVRVHWTLLALLVVLACSSGAGALGTLAAAVLLFGSVVAHELAHATVAAAYGIRTHDIVLGPLGGMARIVGTPPSGLAEVLIALAGPAASLAIALTAWAASQLLAVGPHGADVLETLVSANAMLGLFNLVPAFPMDGGRVLRGMLREVVGLRVATDVAASLGRALAVGMGLLGLLLSSVSLVMIAVFVWIASGRERAQIAAWPARTHLPHACEPRLWDPYGRLLAVPVRPAPVGWPRFGRPVPRRLPPRPCWS